MNESRMHFDNLTAYLEFLGQPAPEHPLFAVINFSSQDNEAVSRCNDEGMVFSSDFYSISLKHIISGEIFYGRTKYDCQSGTMLFTAPNQEISTRGVTVKSTGRSLLFHEDFIRRSAIKEEIKKYHFFSYAINEALHLSPKEESMMMGLFDQIEQEYLNNHDAFSKELILSQLSTLLKYANRFYHRQFLHRLENTSTIFDRFSNELEKIYEAQDIHSKAVPTIEEMADRMNMTPRYLSDALKAETGKTAIENLHLYLIEQAKDMLLKPELSVATVAYNLGFEYPQYFARLFKKKVGVTPTEYRKQFN